jgi:CO/xanthine dehydrogenase Mo-binding subunit
VRSVLDRGFDRHAAAGSDWTQAAAPTAPRLSLKPDRLDSYIAIERDGTITAFFGKIDGGQGLETAMAQMVAEEIEVPLERVSVVMGDTGRTVNMGGASAATGISRAGMNLRRTAAEARRLLIERAADKLGLPADELIVTDGIIHGRANAAKRVSYAALIGDGFDTAVKWNGQLGLGLAVEGQAKIKAPKDFKIIGRSPPRSTFQARCLARSRWSTTCGCQVCCARMIRPTVAGRAGRRR